MNCIYHIYIAGIGVIANFSLLFKAVPGDEIVALQNAIEDDGLIASMPVRPISFVSSDIPSAPVNVTAQAIDSTQIRVEWNEVFFIHANYTVQGYAVFIKEWGDPANPWFGKTIYVSFIKDTRSTLN